MGRERAQANPQVRPVSAFLLLLSLREHIFYILSAVLPDIYSLPGLVTAVMINRKAAALLTKKLPRNLTKQNMNLLHLGTVLKAASQRALGTRGGSRSPRTQSHSSLCWPAQPAIGQKAFLQMGLRQSVFPAASDTYLHSIPLMLS